MIKRNWVIILFLLSLSIFIFSRYYRNKLSSNNSLLKVQSFQTPNGWGYDILINDSVFIHQDIIPSVSGNKGFTTEEQALKVGKLVIKKMNISKSYPTIFPNELDSLGIKRP